MQIAQEAQSGAKQWLETPFSAAASDKEETAPPSTKGIKDHKYKGARVDNDVHQQAVDSCTAVLQEASAALLGSGGFNTQHQSQNAFSRPEHVLVLAPWHTF